MAVERHQEPSGPRVPELDRVIVLGSRRDSPAIATEPGRRDAVIERNAELARSGVPELRSPVPARGEDLRTVGALGSLLQEMKYGAQPVYQPVAATGERARACPACGKELDRALLFGIAIDRCEDHGVWFDQNELAQSFENLATGTKAQPLPDEGFRSLLEEFFTAGMTGKPTVMLSRSPAVPAAPVTVAWKSETKRW